MTETMTEHIHNPWLCPAHFTDCGCEDREGSLCNPYRIVGFCPDDLEQMP